MTINISRKISRLCRCCNKFPFLGMATFPSRSRPVKRRVLVFQVIPDLARNQTGWKQYSCCCLLALFSIVALCATQQRERENEEPAVKEFVCFSISGDFAILLKSGLTFRQAVTYNFASAIISYIGLILGIIIGDIQSAHTWVLALTAGMFLYISLVDMVSQVIRVNSLGITYKRICSRGKFCVTEKVTVVHVQSLLFIFSFSVKQDFNLEITRNYKAVLSSCN